MIISDLQHIKSATETEIQGGKRWRPYYSWCAYQKAPFPDFGTDTEDDLVYSTDTLIIEGQVSGSDFSDSSQSF